MDKSKAIKKETKIYSLGEEQAIFIQQIKNNNVSTYMGRSL